MKYFNISEFDSPDSPGSGSKMQPSTLDKLDRARGLAGIPFVINSGYRTQRHNKLVKGVPGSSHTLGFAVDIAAKSPSQRYKIIRACLLVGFTRIGISPSFIHVDDDPTKPHEVVWVY